MNLVIVESDGPYRCSGSLELRTADGRLQAASELTLCRCGRSRSKPYCDSAHQGAGLERERLHTADIAQAAQTGTLRVRTRIDGPLKLDGPCEIRAQDGTLLMRGQETALCRCGRSQRKPFCDGTHRHTGFQAP